MCELAGLDSGRDREGRSLLRVRFLLLVLQASALCSLQTRASIPSNFAAAETFFFFRGLDQVPFFGQKGDDLV